MSKIDAVSLVRAAFARCKAEDNMRINRQNMEKELMEKFNDEVVKRGREEWKQVEDVIGDAVSVAVDVYRPSLVQGQPRPQIEDKKQRGQKLKRQV